MGCYLRSKGNRWEAWAEFKRLHLKGVRGPAMERYDLEAAFPKGLGEEEEDSEQRLIELPSCRWSSEAMPPLTCNLKRGSRVC
jgi:hypothetical protein